MKSKKRIVKKAKSNRGGQMKGQKIKFLRVRISEKQSDEFFRVISQVEERGGIVKKGEMSLIKKILSNMMIKSEI